MLPLTTDPETPEQQRQHRIYGYKVKHDNQNLVGRMFVHPGIGRLYEISTSIRIAHIEDSQPTVEVLMANLLILLTLFLTQSDVPTAFVN
jgi:hypothetical protein